MDLLDQQTPTDRKGSASPQQRAMLAQFCRTLHKSTHGENAPESVNPPVQGGGAARQAEPAISPRMRQTLELLLAGDSEKQIAGKLTLSPHTVHDYVKAVYRRFGVSSRSELLALWIRR